MLRFRNDPALESAERVLTPAYALLVVLDGKGGAGGAVDVLLLLLKLSGAPTMLKAILVVLQRRTANCVSSAFVDLMKGSEHQSVQGYNEDRFAVVALRVPSSFPFDFSRLFIVTMMLTVCTGLPNSKTTLQNETVFSLSII